MPAIDDSSRQPAQDAGGKRVLPLMTRDEIEAMIASGKHIIIHGGYVLRLDGWLQYHPGGPKAIMHMVGRDATDWVEVIHSQDAKERMAKYRIGRIEGSWLNFRPPIQGGIFRTMEEIEADHSKGIYGISTGEDISSASSRAPSPVFDVDPKSLRDRKNASGHEAARSGSFSSESTTDKAPLDGMSYLDVITREYISLDLEKYPAVDEATQAHIVAKYRELHQKIIDAGLYKTNYSAYAWECLRYFSLFASMLIALSYGYYIISALSLGFLWHQLVFTAHDAGHMGITHNYYIDTTIGIFIADFVGGLSLGWWKHNHNVHHIVTNAPEHDPDIEHMPLFAVSHRLLGSLRSTFYERVMTYDAAAKILLRIQPWTYYPFLALGRFNLYVLSWDYIINGKGPRKGQAAYQRWLELTGQVFFWIWFGYGIMYKSIPDNWSRFVFLMVSHVAASPLHVQIVLSHFAMSTADLGPQESFPQMMLRTTMDVDCPRWLDFVHGGLQFQAIHHLFPRLPRHNFRDAQKLVIEFCKEVDIPYAYYGFTTANGQVIGRLAEVARQAAIFSKCQETITKTKDFAI
ncbi:fatty acid desaturase domain-containing protein [Trichoderma breve]|uniref:Delta 8-(E)-sphingolipid desaturase n=1 Tax=Trichoderma breve TaxID=2034170 RepID=A0A9W9BLQ3_9HYPO|nr:fatty acid desaturase domain-containing protein [Trichoderma breve]KAJ4862228.1 fatty acid desaturase domain-containing protein [Trichoderma breve]